MNQFFRCSHSNDIVQISTNVIQWKVSARTAAAPTQREASVATVLRVTRSAARASNVKIRDRKSASRDL